MIGVATVGGEGDDGNEGEGSEGGEGDEGGDDDGDEGSDRVEEFGGKDCVVACSGGTGIGVSPDDELGLSEKASQFIIPPFSISPSNL